MVCKLFLCQPAEQKAANLRNKNAPTCGTKMRQPAEQKCANLRNKKLPTCGTENKMLYLCINK